MKQLKRILVCMVCALCMCAMMTQPAEAAAKKTIVLKENTAQIQVGTKTTIKVKKVKGLKSKKVTYKSSNRKVARVSSTGVVSGLREGTATITVTSKENKKVKAKFKVKVVKRSDFFTENGAVIRKLGETYTQDGYVNKLVYDTDPSRCMYSADTTVTYEDVYKWNKKYDLVRIKIEVEVPQMDGNGSIYHTFNFFDTQGKQGHMLGGNKNLTKKNEIQLKETSGYFGFSTFWKNGVKHYRYYSYWSVVVPKNKGVYMMFGGYESVEDFENVMNNGLNREIEAGDQASETKFQPHHSYFYISSAEAEKALKKK